MRLNSSQGENRVLAVPFFRCIFPASIFPAVFHCLRAVARECRRNNQRSVQNETAVAPFDLSVCGMKPTKSQKLQTRNLASLVKEMAKPRLAKSTRAKENKGNQRVKIRLKPVLAKTSRGKFPVQIGID